jgi:hypothetical protein
MMGKKIMKRFALAVAATLALMSAPASANEIFTLTGATLQDQYGIASGSMTGSITLNDSLTSIVAVNLQTQGEPSGGGFTFAPVTYTYASGDTNISDTLGPNGYLQIFNTAANDILLDFQTFSPAGITLYEGLGGFSYEHQNAAGNRLLMTGSLVPAAAAVPEPASWTILLGALAMLGLGMLWRSKSSEPRALVS